MDFNSITASLQNCLDWVKQNPLIVTLTSGGVVVWLFTNVKNIWHMLEDCVMAFMSFTVTNIYEDSRGSYEIGGRLTTKQLIFNNFIRDARTLWERSLNLDLSAQASGKMNDMTTKAQIATYGFSIKLVFGKLCSVHRSYSVNGMKMTVTTTMRVWFARKKKFMKRLNDYVNEQFDVYTEQQSNYDNVMVFNTCASTGLKMKRGIDTVFTDNDIHKGLLDDIKTFIDNKETYKKLNYPYNYCALLHGVPGSGKTSTILAVASELNRSIVYIDLTSKDMSHVLNDLNTEPERSIFVFEDIDAVTALNAENRESEDSSAAECRSMPSRFTSLNSERLSLSELLNITDGLLASDGTICIFTTNHIEKLDPAFLRAGRMNKVIEYKYMSPSTAAKMVKTYLGEDVEGLKDNIKPAELQEMILKVILKKCTLDDLKRSFCA